MVVKKKEKPAESEPDRSAILPRLKHTNFVRDLEAIGAPADQVPITEPFIADLVLTYAIDQPGMFQMLSPSHLRRLGLSRSELRDLAMDNLREQLPEIAFKGDSPLYMLVAGNDLEACVLLIDEVWQHLATLIPGEVVVSVPSRDVVMITSSESIEGLGLMKELALEAQEQEPRHGLSEHFLAWRDGKWEIFSSVKDVAPMKPR